jgi:hypothetical protein
MNISLEAPPIIGEDGEGALRGMNLEGMAGGSLRTSTQPTLNRPFSVNRFPRGALMLCPQLCMGIQLGARFLARSADALSATLYGHFTQAIYRDRPIVNKHSPGFESHPPPSPPPPPVCMGIDTQGKPCSDLCRVVVVSNPGARW